MSETKITASAVKSLIGFYTGLPAATFFKGLTGHGFKIEDGVEGIGEITNDSQILHPSYIFMTGGIAKGRKTLKAEDVKSAVEFFQENPLAAVLRVTTGRGFKMDSGMPQFCDVLECENQTIFEITHYGGRSISPMLQQEAGKVSDPNIKWQSGFEYKNVRQNEHLTLIRHLVESDWESQKGLDRVWADLQKEVSRLTFFHCEDKLRSNMEKQDERVRIFLSQELNRYLDGSGAIQLPRGYQHEIRDDGVVIVKKSLISVPQDEEGFQAAIAEFNKVCFQAFSLYCQPLGDSSKVGQPQGEVYGLPEVARVEFEHDSRRSTETEESLIGWCDRVPVFPQDGWKPEKKTYRVFLHRWGKGYRAIPAAPRYDDRYTQIDEDTGSLQVVRVEHDMTEKVVEEEKFSFETKDRFDEGDWWANDIIPKDPFAPDLKEFRVLQVKTDYSRHIKQYINGQGRLDWRQVSCDTKKLSCTAPASEVWLKAPEYHSDQYTRIDLAETYWQVRGKGTDPDGKETETYMKNPSPPPSGETSIFKWEQIPLAIRQAHEKKWPICACGRQRYNSAETSQCSKCTNYRPCARCGKETYFGQKAIAEAKAEGTPLYCDECKKWVEQIDLVNKFVQPAHRQSVMEEAQKLLAGDIFKGQDAQDFFQSVIDDQITNEAEKDRASRKVEQAKGAIGIKTDDGYWMSEFSPEQLEQVARLAKLGEDESTLVIALVACGSERDRRAGGEDEGRAPRVNEGVYEHLAENLNAGEFVLAERLAIPEDHLAQAQERLEKELPELRAKWDSMPGEGNPEGGVSGKGWVHKKQVKRFILANCGTEYRNVGNSKRRGEVYSEASEVIKGNWEAMQSTWISASGIEWLKNEKPYNFDDLLKAFRVEPNFRADLEPFAVSAKHLNELVDEEWSAWKERREEDFWTFLGDTSRHKNATANAMTAELELVPENVDEVDSVEAYIYVEPNSAKMYVNCGKSSKIGTFEVEPSVGDREYGINGVTPDEQGKQSVWQEIPVCTQITCCNYSGSGNLKSKVVFTTPSNLEPGVWAVRRDDKGNYFSPVIYYENGEIVLPEETNIVVREPVVVSAAVAKSEVTGGAVALVTFEFVAKRTFRCPKCGRTERLTKTEFKWYQDGDVIEIECAGCGAAGEIYK